MSDKYETEGADIVQKAYLVIFDSYDGVYGCEIGCGGIFTNEKEAEKVANSLPLGEVYEVQLNTETRIFLGGYEE